MKTTKLLLLLLLPLHLHAAPTKVGNGDDGSDLEGFEKIQSGKIVDSRIKAVQHLKKINSPSIKYLGLLLPEVEKAELYITKKDISAKKLLELGAFTNDAKGLVYARTFPRPHAPTRFFPASENLNSDQLVTLHIHEALHRSLPESIRENEQIVSEVAITLTSPGVTRDQIEQKLAAVMPNVQLELQGEVIKSTQEIREIPDTARVKNPSVFGLAYKKFSLPTDENSNFFMSSPVEGMFELQSHLYPFGEGDTAVGMGIDLSIIQQTNESHLGPLGINLRRLAYTVRGFDFELFGKMTLNTLSAEELENSWLGRDNYTVGLTISKKNDFFYVSNDISYTLAGEVNEKISNIDYKYEFGGVTGIKINAGAYYQSLHLGGFLEMLLSDSFKVSGGSWPGDDIGRLRVLSVGPKLSWKQKNIGVDLYGRILLDSTENISYEYLGNVLEQGVGQGYIGTSVKFFF